MNIIHLVLRFSFIYLLFLCHLFAENQQDPRSHRVMVSIAPYTFFVKAIAGNTVNIELLVPPGASFHTFEPTPKQVLEGAKSDIWFRVGETFESRPLQSIQAYRPQMRIVDLRNGIDLITDGAHKHCCHSAADLHMWLSPTVAKMQAMAISRALMESYPENRDLYQRNLEQLLSQIDALDREISDTLKPLKHRTIMVSHPAYAYFAREYNLTQLPIEFEGKDPSAQQLTRILQQAHQGGIKTIFIQRQYNNKGALLIANELNAKVVTLDPYSDNYFASMREIAQQFAAQDEQ